MNFPRSIWNVNTHNLGSAGAEYFFFAFFGRGQVGRAPAVTRVDVLNWLVRLERERGLT